MNKKPTLLHLLPRIRFALFLAAAIGFSLLFASFQKVLASEYTDENGFTYHTYQLDPYISGYSVKYAGTESEIIIPAEYSFEKVLRLLPEAFADSPNLKSVTLPQYMRMVHDDAFDACESLEEILTDKNNVFFSSQDGILYNNSKTQLIRCPMGKQGMAVIPEGVTEIDAKAFYDCRKLESIFIPATVQKIDLLLPDTLQDIYYAGSRAQLTDILVSNRITAHIHCNFRPEEFQYAISEDSTAELTGYHGTTADLTIPAKLDQNQITAIGTGAFQGCGSLVTADIPQCITRIEAKAFQGCSALKRIIIPAEVTEIGADAFSNCPALEEIYYGGSISQWEALGISGLDQVNILVHCNPHDFLPESYADETAATILYYTGTDTTLTIPAYLDGMQVTGFGSDYISVFEHRMPESVAFSEGVSSIGAAAFKNCENLQKIQLPASLQSIGRQAFENCANLNSVCLPENLETIEDSAFAGCTSLTEISLPQSISVIKTNAFAGCTSLTEISLPQSISGVKTNAFAECAALKDVYYSGTLKQWRSFIDSMNFAGGNDALLTADVHCTEEYLGEPSGNVTVSFNSWGVAEIPQQTVLQFGYLTQPADPIRPGFLFQGWYHGEELWEFEYDRVRTNMTLEARWTEEEEVRAVGGNLIDKEGYTLIPLGKEFILDAGNAAAYPSNITYLWESDSRIVSLGRNGEQTTTITGNEAGTCTVTCTVRSEYYLVPPYGSELVLWDVDTSFVSFKRRIVPYVTSIRIGEKNLTLTPGAYHPLSFTTVPAGNYARALSGFRFTSSDEAVAAVSRDGILSAKSCGTATITASTVNGPEGSTCQAICTVTVTESGILPNPDDSNQPSNTDKDTGNSNLPSNTDKDTGNSNLPSNTDKDTGNSEDTKAPSKTPAPKKGSLLKSGKNWYKVTSPGSSVSFVKTTSAASSLSIPKIVKINGIRYKVTSIGANALKNNRKLKNVTVGNYVTSIGDNAFSGCKRLSRITLGTGIKKIGKKSFQNCGKLKTITLKSSKLSSIGKNAFKGVKASAKLYVPARKLKAYRKLLKGKLKVVAQ